MQLNELIKTTNFEGHQVMHIAILRYVKSVENADLS